MGVCSQEEVTESTRQKRDSTRTALISSLRQAGPACMEVPPQRTRGASLHRPPALLAPTHNPACSETRCSRRAQRS